MEYSQTYTLFRQWTCWCSEWDHDPVSGPIADVANFLADLPQSHFLNSFRPATSLVHDSVDGVEVRKHPGPLKGASHVKPPLPRYTTTWNVQVALQYRHPTDTWYVKVTTNSC